MCWDLRLFLVVVFRGSSFRLWLGSNRCGEVGFLLGVVHCYFKWVEGRVGYRRLRRVGIAKRAERVVYVVVLQRGDVEGVVIKALNHHKVMNIRLSLLLLYYYFPFLLTVGRLLTPGRLLTT